MRIAVLYMFTLCLCIGNFFEFENHLFKASAFCRYPRETGIDFVGLKWPALIVVLRLPFRGTFGIFSLIIAMHLVSFNLRPN